MESLLFKLVLRIFCKILKPKRKRYNVQCICLYYNSRMSKLPNWERLTGFVSALLYKLVLYCKIENVSKNAEILYRPTCYNCEHMYSMYYMYSIIIQSSTLSLGTVDYAQNCTTCACALHNAQSKNYIKLKNFKTVSRVP